MMFEYHNVVHQPLVKKKIILLPLHIKLSLMKHFIKIMQVLYDEEFKATISKLELAVWHVYKGFIEKHLRVARRLSGKPNQMLPKIYNAICL